MGKFAGFQSVQLKRPQRSMFDLTHQRRMTMRMGVLTPVLCVEAVPSDTFRGSSEILMRLAPLLAPIYDQIFLYVHYFFVPNRLLWDEWETFITGGRLGVGIDPVNAPDPPSIDIGAVMATVSPNVFRKSSLLDFLGVPDLLSIDPVEANWNNIGLDIMPAVAYQLCWYEYYRDRNFIADDVIEFPLPSGELAAGDSEIFLSLQTRNYLHDYFTSALPFTQRGAEVMMPLVGTGSVTYLDQAQIFGSSGDLSGGTANTFLSFGANAIPEAPGIPAGAGPGRQGVTSTSGSPDDNFGIANIDEVQITSSGVSINDFRSAYALQVWLERNAIGGSRYTESVQAHFDVKPQDSRLQRPEYIGGGRINVSISEVVSTAWSNDGTDDIPQANLAGRGITYGNTNQFRYFCTEHGFIIGIASIMAPPSYQQGLPRMFRRRTFLDYPWPTFAKLGEQPVFNYEIYADPASLTSDPVSGEDSVFGYQSRYADWKYMCTSNHGEFKDTLLFWTLTRVFASPPVLSVAFNQFQSSIADRIFAVGGEDFFWLYVNNAISVKRPLPYFGTPNTMGFV